MTSRQLPLDPDSAGSPDRPLHLRPFAIALVFVGGAVGTAARYGLAQLMPAGERDFPVGTFVANVVGAFVLGAVLEALLRAGEDEGWRRRARLLVGTGFCGGLTTYSTFAVESDLLVQHHAGGVAVGYVLATVATGVLAGATGIAIAARVHRASA